MKVIKIKNKYLPKDTLDIMPKQINEKDFNYYNFALIYRLPNIIDEGKNLKIRINEMIGTFKWDNDFINNILERYSKTLQNLSSGFEKTISWRMIIGLGAAHPQETSMTLHHIYGIPYIPGSAIKGVTRHWVILDKFNNDEKKAEKNEEFKQIFGIQDKQGKVIFFDAYPAGEIKLKIDVMTPHYGPYYSDTSGKTPPADYHNPNPIKFLTVEKTKFKFFLASKDDDLRKKAFQWLKEALEKYGIGAKTYLGYGFFETEL